MRDGWPTPPATASRSTGLSDHAVSEALYLRDPDHHGIEIYADRPRAQWEGKAGELLTTRPLDTDSLLGELDDPASEPFDGLPSGTVMGHIHLRVASIPETVAFFRDVLGFGLIAELRDQAAFLSAGGYHHHVGANTWESAGAPPAPAGTASLRHATIVLPDADARDARGRARRARRAGDSRSRRRSGRVRPGREQARSRNRVLAAGIGPAHGRKIITPYAASSSTVWGLPWPRFRSIV